MVRRCNRYKFLNNHFVFIISHKGENAKYSAEKTENTAQLILMYCSRSRPAGIYPEGIRQFHGRYGGICTVLLHLHELHGRKPLPEQRLTSIDMLKDKLKGEARHRLEIFCDIIVIFVCYVMIRYGFELLGTVARQNSPTMGIPMNFVYGAMPISCICMLISAIARIVNEIAALRTKSGKENEQ